MSVLNPAWFTESVVALARVCCGNPQADPPVPPQTDKLPILADALEEAGCDDATLLMWFRGGPRPTGVWPAPLEELAFTTPEVHADSWDRHVAYQTVKAAQEAKAARESKYADARREVAVALGESWHKRVADLFQSKRAGVVYGRGGEEVVDWDAYGERGYTNPHTGRKQPAKYKTAGARVIGFARSGRVVLENSRGKEVARLPIPPAAANFDHPALLGGDLFCTVRVIAGVRVATRFGPRRVRGKGAEHTCERSGLGVRLGVPAALRGYGPFAAGRERYWEHGRTVADCRAEYARKLALAESRRAEAEASTLADAGRKRQADRLDRKAKLLLAVGKRIAVGYDDARACGMCEAGILRFAARVGLTDKQAKVPLKKVAETEPGRALDLAKHLIRKREAATA